MRSTHPLPRHRGGFRQDQAAAKALLAVILVLSAVLVTMVGAWFLVVQTKDLGARASQHADDATRIDFGFLDMQTGRVETKGGHTQFVFLATTASNSTKLNLTELKLHVWYGGEEAVLSPGTPDQAHFGVKIERDSDHSANSTLGPYDRGDLMELRVDADALGFDTTEGGLLRIWHVQPSGPSVESGYRVPALLTRHPIDTLENAY